MRRAPRYPSRWAGWMRTLGTTAALSVALGACSNMFGPRGGTMEYPGSGAGPNAVAVYVVNEKDTVDSISQRYGVPSQTIIDRNKLKSPYTLKVGQYLELPGARFVADNTGGATQAAAATAPGPVKRDDLPPPGAKSEPTEHKAASGQPTPLSPSAVEASKAEASKTEATVAATPPPRRFVWPLHGKILTSYGTGQGGQKNDGIDIQATTGEPVKAADGGTVIYAGSDVAHLGNLLLVQHPGGYITAYGNNEALLVKKGDAVKKGQTIAKAGNSGGAASPRLHFEVRRGGSKTVDPMTVLPAQ
ncbi:MAG: peptidoglycan DD-metalloendopeptidase family protein [Rhodospirillales bacterium]|nr:peptidoglycan DD-metalloendopeptidase family protein [Rhodospirillales bacterium]